MQKKIDTGTTEDDDSDANIPDIYPQRTVQEKKKETEARVSNPLLGIIARGWVGFDEENVVVLRKGEDGLQKIVVYDFT